MPQMAGTITKAAERELVLHYIDKLHAVYVQALQAFNRMAFILVIISFLIFSLSLGIVTINKALTLSGLVVTINLALILIGGSILITILMMYLLSLWATTNRFEEKILALYHAIGIDEDILLKDKSGADILGFYGILEIESPEVLGKGRIGKVIRKLIGFIFYGVILLFPILAQIAACWRMIVLFGWTWWIIVSFLFLVPLTTSYALLFWRNT